MYKYLFFFCLLFCFERGIAQDVNAERTQALASQLRCLVCQNETLADSDAPLAKDLRAEISQKISEGDSDQQIISDFTDRYGEFILFKPSLSNKNFILWGAPFVFLALGFLVLFLNIFSRKRKFLKENPEKFS